MRYFWIAVVMLAVAFVPLPQDKPSLCVASKKFTESVILGEIVSQLAETSKRKTEHLRELGGTRIVFESLKAGEVDFYTEYTGTLMNEIFADQGIASEQALAKALEPFGIGMSRPLGFNNTYALGMLEARAEAAGIETLSDLAKIGDLKFGLSSEFLERSDGWPGLKTEYGFNAGSTSGLDHDIAWQQLKLGLVDVIDVYTTEARIDSLNVRVLRDDRNYFPRYDAVLLYRKEAAQKFPDVLQSILQLEGIVTESTMIRCNRAAELDGVSEQQVAADFLQREFQIEATSRELSRFDRIVAHTTAHLELVRRSLFPAILVAVPLGIISARVPWFGHLALGITGILQTIPSFALLVLLLPVVAMAGFQSVGGGALTAIIALFLYSLLPIVRGTQTGLVSIDRALLEASAVLNLSAGSRLFQIELPLASRSILSGIKTAAVMNIGFATLGALVGAGGYGQPILSGIRLANTSLILEGAIPAALMAIAVQFSFEVCERFVVPRGLRTNK